ncbi:MAG TPA: hypothetical protein VM389_13155, partial [Phycisphaerae bacterium]|nr:hypothetical protein [Phycisphaerae bacterium]
VIESRQGDDFWRLEDPANRCQAIAESAKPECLILDFVGNAGRHALVSLGDILGGSYDDKVVERAKRNAKEKSGRGEAADMTRELEEAEEEIEREHHEQRKQLLVKARYKLRNANAFDRLGILAPREPGWHKGRRPSVKQRGVLERAGIPESELDILSFVQASRLIQEVIDRREKGLATFKQVRVLERNGVVETEAGRPVTELRFEEASQEIDKLAKAQGWGSRPA